MNACRPFSPPAWCDRRSSAAVQHVDAQHKAMQSVSCTADLPSRRSRRCALGSVPASPLTTAAPLHPCPAPDASVCSSPWEVIDITGFGHAQGFVCRILIAGLTFFADTAVGRRSHVRRRCSSVVEKAAHRCAVGLASAAGRDSCL